MTALFEQAEGFCDRWLKADPKLKTFFIVNPAAFHEQPINVPPLEDGCRGVSLVGEAFIDQPEVIPFLFELGTPASRTSAKWWCEQAAGAHALSLLAARSSAVDLAGALRSRMSVTLQPAMSLALRLYDTRVMPRVFEVMNPVQRAALFNGISQWIYVDRDGSMKSLPLKTVSDGLEMMPQRRIEFDAVQEDQLIWASHSDQVMTMLGSARRKLSKGRTPSQTHAVVKDLIERANGHGIEGLTQWAEYCGAAARWGIDFDRRSPWRESLEAYRQGRGTLTDALQLDATRADRDFVITVCSIPEGAT